MKRDVAEVEQAGEAELELEPEREDRVDAGDDADEGPEARRSRRAHAVRASPSRPCGRIEERDDQDANATTGF